jgi:peroxiredoxin
MCRVVYLLAIVLLACTPIPAAEDEEQASLKVGDDAPDFALQDAEDEMHALKEMRGKVVLLIMGNRKIRKEDDKWAEAFKKDDEAENKVIGYIVADMRSVPAFVPKGFIKNQLKKNKPPVTLLLDWDGKIHQAYKTIKEKPNLYVINPEGKIAFHTQSNFDREVYETLKAVIDKIQGSRE